MLFAFEEKETKTTNQKAVVWRKEILFCPDKFLAWRC